jgi:copper resistance protein C
VMERSVSVAMRVVTVTAVIVTMLAGSLITTAHGNLESAEPAPNSTIPEAPARVTARFSEELDPEGSSMTVRGPDGSVVDAGDGRADLTDPDRTLMTVTLQGNLPNGTYTVEWVTQSAEDRHTEEGTFRFTVDPAAPAIGSPELVAPTGTVEPEPVTIAEPDSGGIGRGAVIVGLLSVIVAVAVVATIGRRRWWR